jgi:hypothetical protein
MLSSRLPKFPLSNALKQQIGLIDRGHLDAKLRRHQLKEHKMALPTNDDLADCELSAEELDAIAAGGFWSHLRHAASTVGHVASYVGIGTAIALSIFGGVSVATGGAATSRNNVNEN